ncbi:MAG: alpha/beta hydrolase [Gammaproteobacteria bacterium]|nr:alpha/beta hydrolase [Gammaproteobacteria bacterium]
MSKITMSLANPTIFFAHANGFPSQTYRKLFSFLKPDFEIDYINNVGHQAEYSAGDNWKQLALELERQLEQRGGGPVIGVGHSLGGVLLLITALRKPALYQQIILLDSPLYNLRRSIMLKGAKRLNLIDKVTPSASSAKRRGVWSSSEEAFNYFNGKALFKSFDPDCLRDYIEFGTVKTDHGIKLLVEPEIEGEIFRHLPDNLAFKKPSIPATYVHAEKSHVINQADLRSLQRKFNVVDIEGGHLFPFEHPEKTAEVIRAIAQANTLKD